MQLKLLDHDLFIERNSLQQVTSSEIYINNKSDRFSDTGLWSETIFGVLGSRDRQVKFGWIDLKCKVIHPAVFNMILTASIKIRQYILGLESFVIDDGKLVVSTVGETGLISFIKNIDNISFIKNSKPEKLDNSKFLDDNKRLVIIDKFLVLPAGIRDIFVSKGSNQQKLSDINAHYKYLLSLVTHLSSGDEFLNYSTIDKIQKTLINIAVYCKGMLKGKQGLFRSNMFKKTTDYSARLVIVPDQHINIGELGLPFNIVLLIYEPYFFHYVFKKNPELKALIRNNMRFDESHELQLSNIKMFAKNMVTNYSSYSAELHNLLVKTAIDISYDKQVLYKRDPVVERASWVAADIKVLSNSNSAHMSPLDCKRLGADFDGDTIAIMSALTEESQKEARLMNPKYSDIPWRDTSKYDALNYGFSLDLISNLYKATRS